MSDSVRPGSFGSRLTWQTPVASLGSACRKGTNETSETCCQALRQTSRPIPRGKAVYLACPPPIRCRFTSTATKLHPTAEDFGRQLFVITIPNSLESFAINIKSLSEFPKEDEVLLPPNAALMVTEVQRSPDPAEYPEVDIVVYMVAVYMISV